MAPVGAAPRRGNDPLLSSMCIMAPARFAALSMRICKRTEGAMNVAPRRGNDPLLSSMCIIASLRSWATFPQLLRQPRWLTLF